MSGQNVFASTLRSDDNHLSMLDRGQHSSFLLLWVGHTGCRWRRSSPTLFSRFSLRLRERAVDPPARTFRLSNSPALLSNRKYRAFFGATLVFSQRFSPFKPQCWRPELTCLIGGTCGTGEGPHLSDAAVFLLCFGLRNGSSPEQSIPSRAHIGTSLRSPVS